MADPALMQRVRIGLTGLACVFLLVVLAAAMLGFADDETGPAGPPDAPKTTLNTQVEAPKEPLAELGVAPGNLPDQGTANAARTMENSAR